MRRVFAVMIALCTCVTMLVAQEPKPKRLSVVSVTTYLTTPTKIAKVRQVAEKAGVEIQFVAMEETSSDALSDKLALAKLLLIDAAHTSVEASLIEKFADTIQKSQVPYVWMGGLDDSTRGPSSPAGGLADQRAVDPVLAKGIRESWRFGGKQNTQMLVESLKRDRFDVVANSDSITAAVVFPEQGIYHPDWKRIEADTGALSSLSVPNQKGIAAIAINRAVLTSDDTDWLDELMDQLRQRGVVSYAFYGPRENVALVSEMTCDSSGRRIADLIVNASLVFRPNEIKEQLEKVGLPVLQTLPSLAMNTEAWRNSVDGLALADISYYYASSELAGMIDPLLITARNTSSGSLEPISAQIKSLADKAASTIRLQRTQTSDRRVAVMVYNYPLGESNFGASFLNVPKSLANILDAMRGAGYAIDDSTADDLTTKIQSALRSFYDADTVSMQLSSGEAELLPLDIYTTWFRALPETTQRRIEDYWGTPDKSAIQSPKSGQLGFAIPVVKLGNVSVLAQPLRHEIGSQLDADLRKKRIGHRSSVPLSHTYLATYLWLREQWKADAVVHLGTHGTVEWAPGKERGLAVDDDPYLALGSLPNIYPYIMDNLGEALTAKRRGRAIIVSHMTPSFTPAGFRPGLHEMHDLMHEWELASPGPLRQQIEKSLIESFVEHQLDRDLGWTPKRIAGEFAAFMEVLHPYLDDIAQSAQPQGLAVFGEAPDENRRLGMVMQMLRKPLIDALGEDIDEVFLLDYEKVVNSRPARWLRLALRDAEAASNLDLRQIDSLDTNTHSAVPNRAREKPIDTKVLLELARRAQTLDATLANNGELQALLTALDGRHVASSYGGDPVRNPESLPTGRNLYGFDPSRVPTRQAWQLGVGVLDQWIANYRIEHDNAMPRKIAFSLWAGETMRHQGVMESQVLYAMGARPQWDVNGRVTGIEIIPSGELKRDRIDVLLSVTGSYRDQFPLVMQWIDQAVREVSTVDEPGNGVAGNTKRIRDSMSGQGVDAAKADRLATARIFSNEPGVYGTGLNDAVNASDLWKSQATHGGDVEMAQLFVDRMGYAFGVEGSASNLFVDQLAEVDAAMASRTSNTYAMLTSDDPFAYIGGLALAARVFSDHAPELYVQNLRDESEVIVDPAAQAIAKEMQSRYLHPQWIQSQMGEGYSGTLQVLKTTQFLWGWQVTAPETVRDDQWDSLFDVYVQDKYQLGTMQWMKQENQGALAQMLERMIDAARLGYWDADDATMQTIMQTYQAAKEASDSKESHAAVDQFVSTRMVAQPESLPDARVDSVTSVDSNPTAANTSVNPDETTLVRGIELKPQTVAPMAATESNPGNLRQLGWAAAILLFLAGVIRQRQRFRRRANTR